MQDAELELELQSKMIFPVLNSINTVAHNPKYKQAETQTDCQIGCYKAHIMTQVNSKSLQEAGTCSINQLQSVIQQVREKTERDAKNAEDLDTGVEAHLAAKKKAKEGVKGKKKKSYKDADDPNVMLLNDIEKNPASLNRTIDDLNDWINQLCANTSPYAHLDDFICSKLLDEHKTAVKSAQVLEKMVNCFGRNKKHPVIKQFSQILGLNGYERMDSGLLTYYLELRDIMVRESGALSDSITYQSAVDFIKKSFKNNIGLVCRILGNLYTSITADSMSALDHSLKLPISQKEFKFPEDYTTFKVKHFFSTQNEDFDGNYIE